MNEGLEQTVKYMDVSHAKEGHLLIFDRDPNKSCEEKCRLSERKFKDYTIEAWET